MIQLPMLDTILYTYTGALVLCTVVAITVVYSLRDVLGGLALAVCVMYLYNM